MDMEQHSTKALVERDNEAYQDGINVERARIRKEVEKLKDDAKAKFDYGHSEAAYSRVLNILDGKDGD